MSREVSEAEGAGAAGETAKQAPTEQQESRPGVPRRFLPGQTVCSEKNEKGKLCNGHLKQVNTQHPSDVHLRGDDALHKCQTCGALYMGPPLGHVRDTRKQSRFVERELAAILQAAGGTLPAYDYPPGSMHAPAGARRAVKPAPAEGAAPPAAKAAAPAGETPEQKKARLIAEHKAKLAAKAAEKSSTAAPSSAPTADKPAPTEAGTPAPTSGADSSSAADSHRPAAATASPAAGAETASDLAPEASTELTPGAPKDERKES